MRFSPPLCPIIWEHPSQMVSELGGGTLSEDLTQENPRDRQFVELPL